MVEQPDVLLDERNAKLLRGLEDSAIILAACRSSDVLGTAPVRPEDVVDEGEEGIGADGNALHLGEPLFALIRGEWLGYLFEVGLEIVALDA